MAFDKVRDVRLFADDGSGYTLPITGSDDGSKHRLDVALGLAVQPGFNIPPYDAVYGAYPDTVTEVFTYKAAGVTVAVITAIYTDATKTKLSSAVKT